MQKIIQTPGIRDKETASLKIPPHSIEAEIAVLGGVLLDNSVWEKIVERVSEEDFYRKDHRIIFHAIATLDSDGKPFDVVTVAEWLDSHKQLEDAGGLPYLAALAENTAGSGNITAYADIASGHDFHSPRSIIMPTSLAPRIAPFLFRVIFTQGTLNSLRITLAISDINFSTSKNWLASTKEIMRLETVL